MRLFSKLLVATLCSVSTLNAQELADACDALGDVTVGQWAGYRLSAREIPSGSASIRLAIVSGEAREGKDYFWHEMKMEGGMGEIVVQMLVPHYPFDSDQIVEAVMKPGDQPAMKMPPQMLSMMRGQQGNNPAADLSRRCNEAELVGWEEVEVEAGTFRTMHLRTSGAGMSGEVWVSLEIPFGLVKFAGDNGSEMILVDHGTGAVSSITEEPRAMPGMPR